MEIVDSVEKQLVDINKGLPKLPAGLLNWCAKWSWLLILLTLIFSIMSLVMLVPIFLIALGIDATIVLSQELAGYGVDAPVGGLTWLSVLLAFINLVIVIILEAKAVTPLKRGLYNGWKLIFTALLISTLLGVISSIVTGEATSLAINLIAYAIGFYVILQLRPSFRHKTK